MKKLKIVVAIELAIIVVLALMVAAQNVSLSNHDHPKQAQPKFFVGVELGYETTVSQAKAVIDRVKDYTNLIVIATPTITADAVTLNETCDYAYKAGMYIMVYFSMQMYPDSYPGTSSQPLSLNNTQVDMTEVAFRPFVWVIGAQERYGDHFLAVYFHDEPGGTTLDTPPLIPSGEQPNYTELSNAFVQKNVTDRMNVFSPVAHRIGVDVLTSDYGLYWFDYKGGYDVVLAQLGWNNSRPLQIGLTRGAANIMGHDWGTILTWTYDKPPYMENATAFYKDMKVSYDAGAKYVVIYDSTQNYTGTTLTEDHYTALRNFWNYVQQNPKNQGSVKADVALILPQDYGFGFRSPIDSVWGVKSDALAPKMYADVMSLVDKYGYNADVIYSDPEFAAAVTSNYTNTISLTNG